MMMRCLLVERGRSVARVLMMRCLLVERGRSVARVLMMRCLLAGGEETGIYNSQSNLSHSHLRARDKE
jgi:hypothetical protein